MTTKRRTAEIDDERMPTSCFDMVKVGHVEIESRYCKECEFELMAKAIRNLDEHLRAKIMCIFCDSEAMHFYSVTLRPGLADQKLWEEEIAIRLHDEFCSLAGGHGEITVGTTWFDCDWRQHGGKNE